MSTPSNIQIIAQSVLDATTLVSDDTDPLYPLTNLQIPQTSLKWRTNTYTPGSIPEQQIVSDLVSYESLTGWSLNGHNLSFGSTVRLSLYNTINRDVVISSITWAAGVATVTMSQLHGMYDDESSHAVVFADVGGAVELNGKCFDCTVINSNTVTIEIASMTPYTTGGTLTSLIQVYDRLQDGYPVTYGWGEQPWGLGGWYGYDTTGKDPDYVNFWFDQVTANYMRVIINNPENDEGYIEAGRIILGLSMKPKYNFLWGAGINYKSQTQVVRTRSGSLISDNRPSYRVADLRLSYLSEDEAMLLLDMMDNPGVRSDALISMYPDDTGTLGQRTTILGRFMNHSAITRNRFGYSISISFQEAL